MFKFITIAFLSSIALANPYYNQWGLIAETEKLATRVISHYKKIKDTQVSLSIYYVQHLDSTTGAKGFTLEESLEMMVCILQLKEKAEKVIKREYLSKTYTQQDFEETYIQFHEIIDRYKEVLFNVAQREYNPKSTVSFKDLKNYTNQDLTKDILRAMRSYFRFTSGLQRVNRSILHLIETGDLSDISKVDLEKAHKYHPKLRKIR